MSAIALPDGRRLEYAVHGRDSGREVLVCHGSPGSRRFGELFADAADDQGVAVVTPSRAGAGGSDLVAHPTLTGFVDDAIALLDHLEWKRCDVVGCSGGGAFAAALAARRPARVRSLSLVASLAPFDAPDITKGMHIAHRARVAIARHAPWLMHAQAWLFARGLAQDAEATIDRLAASMSPSDRDSLRGHTREWLIADLKEAFNRGHVGAAREQALFGRPWGFSLHDISVPTHLWFGDDDQVVPPAMARHLERAIANATSHRVHGGHFWLFEHGAEVLSVLDGGDV
jgi:pimeloyl-ACP methyl ester carboxylesterase